MSVCRSWVALVPFVFFAGCQPVAETAVRDNESTAVAKDGSDTNSVAGDTVALTPDNTSIEFVGSHIVENGPDPNARQGRFNSFSGTATVNGGLLTAVSLEIDAASIETTAEKLTAHLKSPDFFDVREHPKLTFVSTEITAGQDGHVAMTGDLTMLDETKSISFPATVNTDGDLELSAEFTVDRTEFGMTFGTDKVEKDVSLTVRIQSN